MTKEELTEKRIANQYIGGGAKNSLELVRHMGAMQAQDYPGALWSIGLRTGQTKVQVEAAIAKGDIVRTWPQRGTLHFVAARDAKWQVGLSAERLIRGVASRHERLQLNEVLLAKSKTVLTKALGGGKIFTRAKIMETLQKAGLDTNDGRGYHTLWYLSQTGVLVAGPVEGKEQTFTLLDEWVKNLNTFSREKGIAELAKRYFTSHGPATLADFMWWSGLTSKDAKAGLAAHGTQFVSEKFEGREYWMAKKGVAVPAHPQRAYLLPGFDEYMLGYKDRSAGLPLPHTNKIVPGGNGMFLATVVIEGQVVGTWKKEIKKAKVIIKLSPFKKLTKADLQLLEAPAKQYAHFLGLEDATLC